MLRVRTATFVNVDEVFGFTMNDCQKLGDKDAEPPSYRTSVKLSEKDI